MRSDDSVAKLRQLLKMLDSQIILDSGMQEGVNMERNTKKTEHRMRQRSLSRPEAWQTLNFGPETTNGDFEDEESQACQLCQVSI